MGLKSDLDFYKTQLARHFEMKIRGRIGGNCDGCQQLKILNRVARLNKDGLVYEADPGHVDLLAGSLGLTAANSVTTPGVKDPEPDYAAEKHDESNHARSERRSNRDRDERMPCRTHDCNAALAPEATTNS